MIAEYLLTGHVNLPVPPYSDNSESDCLMFFNLSHESRFAPDPAWLDLVPQRVVIDLINIRNFTI